MTPRLQPERYVPWVIHTYLRLPHTPARARHHDHHLAAQLHRRRVPHDIIEAAFLLATLRRIHRPPGAAPLNPIRSLHYFLPVIDELLESPPSPGYLKYLRRRYAETLAPGPLDEGSKKIVFT